MRRDAMPRAAWRCDAQIKEQPRRQAEVNGGRRAARQAARQAAVDTFASADAHSLMPAALAGDGCRSVSRIGQQIRYPC
jgi:hypothetical protein